MPGGTTGRGRSTAGQSIVPSAITIAAQDLAALQFLATAPLSKQLRGASPPRGTESPIEAKEERKARMRALDLERLRAKVESGGADEEKVVALVGKLGEWAAGLFRGRERARLRVRGVLTSPPPFRVQYARPPAPRARPLPPRLVRSARYRARPLLAPAPRQRGT